jgi:hypothetical protein
VIPVALLNASTSNQSYMQRNDAVRTQQTNNVIRTIQCALSNEGGATLRQELVDLIKQRDSCSTD